ncbi:MAG: hypothetical protein JSW10_12225 [Pseudomonadota bacterium]|nr:MAG: hypothetical protein JSW10_12225 [Pseudomonadota bacterium]
MNLIRLIALALVIFLIFHMVRKWWRGKSGDIAQRDAGENRKQPKKIADMVRCAQCGLHIPEHESLNRDGRHFCSKEHLEQHRDS